MRRSALARTLVGLALVFGFVVLRAGSAMAQDDTAAVTIHKAECFHGVGPAIFEECHDNGIGGVDFFVTDADGEHVITTDDAGVASIEVVAGNVSIAEDGDVLAQYLGAYVYCSDQNTGDVLFDSDLDGTVGVAGTINAGADITCDWYDILPAEDTGGGDTGGGTTDGGTTDGGTTSTGGTTLPSTGAGRVGGPSDGLLLPSLGLAALAMGGAAVGLRRRDAR
jgi:hypothetical protein